ncbi:uncharacterized protein LOC124134215 isoform X2 [Haliotis rufescens]|nr:uncharacterized protein LOC124134215 isoform X2 [Haliotis rufescens]
MSEPQEKVDMSALKDTFLECPVCVEHFNQTDRCPRLLHSCLHAFCTLCLQQLLTKEGKGQITCPLCRRVHKVPGKAETLPVDAVRAKLVDFVQIRNEGKVPCTDCPEGSTAESRCPECSLYLCKDCTHVHKRHQLTNDHTIISLSDVLQQPLNTFGKRHCCTHHPKHQLEFFCATDETLCCMACTVMEHKGHEFQKLEEAAKKRQDELETLMQTVLTNAQQLRQRRLSEEGRQNTIVQAQGKAKSDVSIYFKSLTSIINLRKALLDQDIDQRSNTMLSLSKKEVEAIDQTLAVMDSTVTYFTQAREKADVVEMLQVYPAIKRSLEASADGQGQGQSTATEILTFCPSNGKIVDKLVSEVGCVRESTETLNEGNQLLLCLNAVFDAALKYKSKNQLIKHLQALPGTGATEFKVAWRSRIGTTSDVSFSPRNKAMKAGTTGMGTNVEVRGNSIVDREILRQRLHVGDDKRYQSLPRERSTSPDDTCCICMDTITVPKKLPCGHTFCADCIRQAFKVKLACPVCGKLYGIVKGNQPKGGKMTHKLHQNTLPGYEDAQGVIVISYEFPAGLQQADHPEPGRRYSGIHRIAYLPYNYEGWEVLRLLYKAFDSYVTFTIGVFGTTGGSGVITWNGIRHKTSMAGGSSQNGYPDSDYLKEVKKDLALKGIAASP